MSNHATAFTSSANTFVCLCVDPEVAAEYNDRSNLTPEDIVATDAQWATLASLNKGLDTRAVSAYGSEDGSTWRFTLVDDCGVEGPYGMLFPSRGDWTIMAGGEYTNR